MSKLKQQIGENHLCAGMECPERDECTRFLRPINSQSRMASFDIERQKLGTCEAKIQAHVHVVRGTQKHRR